MKNNVSFGSTDITGLILAILVIVLQVGCWLVRFSKYHGDLKTDKLLSTQPYQIAVIIVLSYFVVNEISLPVLDLSLIMSRNIVLKIGYSMQIIRLVLTIVLVYKQEKAIYLWLGQFARTHKVLVAILFDMRKSINVFLYSIILMALRPEFVAWPKLEHKIDIANYMLIIWSIVWIIIQFIAALEKIYLRKILNLQLVDYHERGVFTQTKILKKIVILLIIIIAIAATCLVFEDARIIGTSILASAGIATGVLGFAANKIISNFFVGIQIAITKPIKINDLVKINDEYGVVEDITLNYAIIQLWDLRRLIIPINYLLEKHFYNYSLNSTVITSVIVFFADYRIPVAEIRSYFIQAVRESTFWDRDTVALQVIGFEDKSLKLRGTASTNNPSNAWNLKCEILEKLAGLLGSKYQSYLPKVRFDNSQSE